MDALAKKRQADIAAAKDALMLVASPTGTTQCPCCSGLFVPTRSAWLYPTWLRQIVADRTGLDIAFIGVALGELCDNGTFEVNDDLKIRLADRGKSCW